MLEGVNMYAAGVKMCSVPKVSVNILIFDLFRFLYTKF